LAAVVGIDQGVAAGREPRLEQPHVLHSVVDNEDLRRRLSHLPLPRPAEIALHEPRQVLDLDRLLHVPVEALRQQALAVSLHGEGRQRDDGDVARAVVGPEHPEGLDALTPAALPIHQDEGGTALAAHLDAGFAAVRLDGRVPLQPEEFTYQLRVAGIVLYDQDQVVSHGSAPDVLPSMARTVRTRSSWR